MKIYLFVLLVPLASFGQKIKNAYPQNYFACPVMPGQRNYLSGGFADLRADHFHAGIDFKTQQREGLPIYAAAEGYVYKIKVLRGGYGNAVFLKHPNGYITVYGHLREFNPAIEKYVRSRQYAQQTFEIDLTLEPQEIPVKKLEIIGLSGNTGGSGGPHLHFETRSGEQQLVNPVLMGFAEIQDDVPPFFQQIALMPLAISSRVEKEFNRKTYTVTKKSAIEYLVSQPVTAIGEIGLEILAFDRTSGADNKNGVNCMEIRVDGEEVYAHHLDEFPNDISRDMNVHVNHEVELLTGQRYQRCYVSDGNRLPIYEVGSSGGKLRIIDGKLHQVSVTIWDGYENMATLQFSILGNAERLNASLVAKTLPLKITQKVQENTLVIKADNLVMAEPTAQIWVGKTLKNLPASYTTPKGAIFLYDLRNGLPDSVTIDKNKAGTTFQKSILPNKNQRYEANNLSIDFPVNALYDTLYLETQTGLNVLKISEEWIPMKEAVTVAFKPQTPPADPLHTHVYQRKAFVGGTWNEGRISFKTRNLGEFQLLTDTEPPAIKMLARSPESIRFNISDNLSGIDKWRCTLNGEWLLLHYDYKRALLWTEKLDKTVPFATDAKLRLELTDRAGNVKVFEN